MGFLKVLDHIEKCSSNEDGDALRKVIYPFLSKGESITISFSGVHGIPSSFVNSAFIELLQDFTFEDIKTHIYFVDTSPQINNIIKKRFLFETTKRHQLKTSI